jgi:hypothetical protein
MTKKLNITKKYARELLYDSSTPFCILLGHQNKEVVDKCSNILGEILDLYKILEINN